MSFHTAQPGNHGSSKGFESLDNFSKQSDSDSCDGFTDSSVENTTDSSVNNTAALQGLDEETRFELLSAYLDDEVTPEERRLVAQWLRNEPEVQQMYQRLLMLRQAMRMAPVPEQPPLQVPSPTDRWETSSSVIRWTLVCATAIALLSGLSQLGTNDSRQHLEEAWQFIRSLPQGTLLEFATTAVELPTNNVAK